MIWLRNLIIVILVPGTFVLLFPLWIINRTQQGIGIHGLLWAIPGGVLILAGLAAIIWVVVAFSSIGKGTPAPFDPPRKFVAQGLFRFVRNPMYVGALIALLGVAIMFQTLWVGGYALVLFLVLNGYVHLFEEAALKKRFGLPYEDYLKEVPRWIPRLKRKE